jgi:hypothetical protein
MNYDCGLIVPSPAYNWVQACGNDENLPSGVKHELYTLLNTPGFDNGYWGTAFKRNRTWARHATRRAQARLDIDLAILNWSSVTRDDALKLASYRVGSMHMPTICRVWIADDLANGMTHYRAGQVWGLSPDPILSVVRYGPFFDARLPDWFLARIPT